MHDQVDVELDAVEVLLEQKIVATAEDHVVLGGDDTADERVHLGERFEVVDAQATDRARPELRLHHGGEAHVRGRRKELVERADATRLRRGQSELGGQLAGSNLAAGGVDRVDRVGRQAQRRRHTGGYGHALFPDCEDTVGSHVGPFQRVEHGPRILVRFADDRRR